MAASKKKKTAKVMRSIARVTPVGYAVMQVRGASKVSNARVDLASATTVTAKLQAQKRIVAALKQQTKDAIFPQKKQLAKRLLLETRKLQSMLRKINAAKRLKAVTAAKRSAGRPVSASTSISTSVSASTPVAEMSLPVDGLALNETVVDALLLESEEAEAAIASGDVDTEAVVSGDSSNTVMYVVGGLAAAGLLYWYMKA